MIKSNQKTWKVDKAGEQYYLTLKVKREKIALIGLSEAEYYDINKYLKNLD